jgi:asparagine synthase (glutamine-hydrolysing)
VDACPAAPNPNREALPAFFLYRFVPGGETLFQGIHRLMPGELLTFDGHAVSLRQRQTFAELHERHPVGRDSVARVEATLGRIMAECAATTPSAANLLSGGVDSSYLQALWNRVCADTPTSFSVTVDHPRTRLDTEYALSAARELKTQHRLVPADAPYASYLLDTLAATGEPPNHVMAAYFGALAATMTAANFPVGICGEGADSLFGISSSDLLHKAKWLRALLPFRFLRRRASALADRRDWRRLREPLQLADYLYDLQHFDHPVNHVALFTDLPAVQACFGTDAIAEAAASRRALLDKYRVPASPLDRMHAIGYLGEAVDSASLWTTLFNRAGGDLRCPFLDSRILRLALSLEPRYRYRFRKPKYVLKEALSRHVPRDMAYRFKLGFGQPIFEWMAPGGQLRSWVEQIGRHDFVDRAALATALARPNWFLYSLLCYDLWHKLFIERSIPRTQRDIAPRHIGDTALAAAS